MPTVKLGDGAPHMRGRLKDLSPGIVENPEHCVGQNRTIGPRLELRGDPEIRAPDAAQALPCRSGRRDAERAWRISETMKSIGEISIAPAGGRDFGNSRRTGAG